MPVDARDSGFLNALVAELEMARVNFPDRPTMAVLVEEVGEVARALQDESREAIYLECVQVAAMAMRMATEGCREYERSWPDE
jgi:hypothetical protein